MTRMRVGLVALVVVAGLASVQGLHEEAVTLIVSVDGFENARGTAGIALWSGAAGFPESIEHATATSWAPIEDGRATARLGPLAPGAYAVTVFHDRNDNRTFDKNWLGIPREAWGVSNNVRPRLRAPRFDEASFDALSGTQVVQVHVE